ncbi:hypothetical protein CPLU01_00023 [Colletotrichum plurivorum]|uniref:RRM domain-containing protein n=1 Tax=Colletotrichum plurivorum TaxID=2175906 RepID=A0A8H6NST3_9PEZI|nr:hypothetical protein CPLU01_00023 [Colletotrichum plurivorum]
MARAESADSRGFFKAMRTVTIPREVTKRTPSKGEIELSRILRRLRDFPPNYEGDTINTRNKSADIPDNLNTSVWITGLPPTCTCKTLLVAMAQVGRLGKIWSTVINPPNPKEGKFYAAAKVVFFTREGAERLIHSVEAGRLVVAGRRPLAIFNRIKSAPQKESLKSRVVIFEGPVALVNECKLKEWFLTKFTYQTESVQLFAHNSTRNTNVLEWSFGSYRGQAEAAVIAVTKELDAIVQWKHG